MLTLQNKMKSIPYFFYFFAKSLCEIDLTPSLNMWKNSQVKPSWLCLIFVKKYTINLLVMYSFTTLCVVT